MEIGNPSSGQRINALKNQLVMLQSDLACMDEQREKLKDQIAATRNYLNGVLLGQRQAAEAQAAANELLEYQDIDVPANPGGTD